MTEAIAVISLILSALITARLIFVERRLSAAELRLRALGHESDRPRELPEPSSPLMGLRVQLAVVQDHPQAILAELIRQAMLREDVADVGYDLEQYDLKIEGRIVCNGYADVYYDANLACSTERAVLFTLVDKPATGDRPSNLAIQLVDRLKRELPARTSREERQQAIRELS
jgi:hypothetical protein